MTGQQTDIILAAMEKAYNTIQQEVRNEQLRDKYTADDYTQSNEWCKQKEIEAAGIKELYGQLTGAEL